MRRKEQDYPSRAAYAAALTWWEILRITIASISEPYSERIIPPEEYGVVKRVLVSSCQPVRSSGKPNWILHLYVPVLIALALGGIWFFGSKYDSWEMIWLWFLFVFVVGISVMLWASVLLFRAGAWEQILEKRAKKLALKRKQKSWREGCPSQ